MDFIQPIYLIYLQSPQPFIPPVTLCPRQQDQPHHHRETGHWAYHGSRQVALQLSQLRLCFDSHIRGAEQIVPSSSQCSSLRHGTKVLWVAECDRIVKRD